LGHIADTARGPRASHSGPASNRAIWKMKEDLSGPYPGFGLGALDALDGYEVYRLLDEEVTRA